VNRRLYQPLNPSRGARSPNGMAGVLLSLRPDSWDDLDRYPLLSGRAMWDPIYH
jgi:hypothetical protein